MDRGKNIQMELTGEELQRKIEQISREIQESKEEGLRVDMATAIYKAATVTLDEDLVSQIKKKKDVEIETEDLREKLDTFRLKVQEREAREERIESETDTVLAKSVSLDEELTVEMEEFPSMRKSMVELRKKNKSFHSNMINKLQKCVKNIPSTRKGLIVVPITLTLERLGKTMARKSTTNLHS